MSPINRLWETRDIEWGRINTRWWAAEMMFYRKSVDFCLLGATIPWRHLTCWSTFAIYPPTVSRISHSIDFRSRHVVLIICLEAFCMGSRNKNKLIIITSPPLRVENNSNFISHCNPLYAMYERGWQGPTCSGSAELQKFDIVVRESSSITLNIDLNDDW